MLNRPCFQAKSQLREWTEAAKGVKIDRRLTRLTMPIYEFHSPDTNKIYTFFARSLSYADKVPKCPDDPVARMERMVSKFAFTGRAKEKTETPDVADPRMEKMMAEMEREMSSLDENNPDPKALGRMMRKMAEATGQAMPDGMDQMIRRLEAGEDPEKLEEEFGDAFEGMDMPEGDGGEAPATGPKARHVRAVRDPALYEFSDYL